MLSFAPKETNAQQFQIQERDTTVTTGKAPDGKPYAGNPHVALAQNVPTVQIGFIHRIVLLCAILASAPACADNMTVAAENEEKVSADASYDALTVNGTLTIAEGINVTAKSLVVATNLQGSAYVVLEPEATLTVSGDVHLGYDGGQAHLEAQSGACLSVVGSLYMAYGHCATPASGADVTRAFLVASNATVEISGAEGLTFLHSQYWPSGTTLDTSVDEVRLEDGAVLKCPMVRKTCTASQRGRSSTIVFDGGRIEGHCDGNSPGVVRLLANSAKTTLNLVATNGCPVHLAMNETSAGSYSRWFDMRSKGCIAKVCGGGGLVLENNQDAAKRVDLIGEVKYINTSPPNLRFAENLGLVRVIGGSLHNAGTNILSSVGTDTYAKSFSIEGGASLDIGGVDSEFLSLTGRVTNASGAACTLAIGGDTGSTLPYAMPEGVTLVKNGSGRLDLFAADTESVVANGGTLALVGRERIGYQFYKFNIYGVRGTGGTNRRAAVSEFQFLNGAEDVTQGYTQYYYVNNETSYYNSPTNMFDGDTSTWFYDQRAQSWATVSNIHVEVEYVPCRKVTGYTWYVNAMSDYTTRRQSSPTNWAVFGSADNATWELLDLVDGFGSPSSSGAWCGTNFVCRYSGTSATIDNLALVDGAVLEVDGAEVEVLSATALGGVPVTLSGGASLTLPEAVETASVTVDMEGTGGTLVNFRPVSGGALHLLNVHGSVRGKSLPVAVENLFGNGLSGWGVYADGVRISGAAVEVKDGFLRVFAGFVLSVR